MIERTRMFSDSPWHAGPQRARAAHDQVDLHAGLRCRIQRADHASSSSAFILAMMRAGGPLARARLAPDHLDDAADAS